MTAMEPLRSPTGRHSHTTPRRIRLRATTPTPLPERDPAGPAPGLAPPGPASLPPYALESVDRALRLLSLLPTHAQLRVTDVSRELGVAPSTAHRLLSTLAHRGFVTADDQRAYRAGPAFWALTAATEPDDGVPAGVRPHLVRLAEDVGETITLTVLDGLFCRFVGVLPGSRPLRSIVRIGSVLPSHTVSGGKALLAQLPPRKLRTLLAGHRLVPMTPRSIASLNQLADELATVRETGYATNVGESEEGITAVAMPVHGPDGTAVAAVAVSAPTARAGTAPTRAVLEPLAHTVSAIGRALLPGADRG
jgi:DNA-binding IclR family transcriptional regulator